MSSRFKSGIITFCSFAIVAAVVLWCGHDPDPPFYVHLSLIVSMSVGLSFLINTIVTPEEQDRRLNETMERLAGDLALDSDETQAAITSLQSCRKQLRFPALKQPARAGIFVSVVISGCGLLFILRSASALKE